MQRGRQLHCNCGTKGHDGPVRARETRGGLLPTRGGWGAGCSLQAGERRGVSASRSWVCWMGPGVGLDKVIGTALSPEHFAQLWVWRMQLVLGFCPWGCSSPALQVTSVASLSRGVFGNCCSCSYKSSSGCWLSLVPFASLWPPALLVLPFGLVTCGSPEFPRHLFSGLLSSPLWLLLLCPAHGDPPLPKRHCFLLCSAPSQLREPMYPPGWWLPAPVLPDPSGIPLLLQVQQPGSSPCHQEEYDGDHEGKAEAAEDAQQDPSADG